MEEIRIAYKDDYPCFFEGTNIYLSLFSLKRKKYFLICALVSFINLIIINIADMINENDKVFLIVQCVVLVIMVFGNVMYYYLYTKIHSKQIASMQFLSCKEQEKEVVLRNDDLVFLRKYCKSNYFYDEIAFVIEGKKSISIVIEKSSFPVIISKTPENEKEISLLCSILKEKVGDRYIDKTRGGRRK